jgi:multiple sugar transport system substrate-binding protein
MKILLKLIVIVLFFYSAISCSRNNQNNNEPILYWCSNNNDEIIFAKAITDNWNKNNPDQIVKYQPVPEGRSSEEIILAAVVGNTTPDIYSNMWQGDVEAYAQAGVLIALDTLEGFTEFLYDRCDSSVVEEIKSLDGHIYQIPWKINPIMLIYNVNLIKELDLNGPPKTYTEFFNASQKFQKDFDSDGYVDRWFGYSEVEVTWWQRFFDFYPLYLAASGGAPLVKNDQAAFNNKYAVEVFSFLQEMYRKNYFSKEKLSARQDVFLSSVTATRFTGPWEIAHAEKFKPKGFEYEYSFMPVPDNHNGPVYTYGDPKNIVIFKTCKKPQAAWYYIKTMITNEGDLMMLSLTNQLPRRKNLNQDIFFNDYFTSNPKMKIFAEQSNYVRGTDASPVLKEIFDLISQEYEACVVYGMKTPEKAINDAADAVNLLFLK